MTTDNHEAEFQLNRLWPLIVSSALGSLGWKRRASVNGLVGRIYCKRRNLVVEVRGGSVGARGARGGAAGTRVGRAEASVQRPQSLGQIKILRFSTGYVQNKISEVLQKIADECKIELFPHNPQASSQQDPLSKKLSCCDDESGGNVEKPAKTLRDLQLFRTQSSGKLVELVSIHHGPAFFARPACQRQVYACQEVAEDTVRALRPIGFLGDLERCPQCGQLHLSELWKR